MLAVSGVPASPLRSTLALLAQAIEDVANLPEYRRWGRVAGVNGMLIELGGMPREVTVGSRCEVATQEGRRVACEIVGFRGGKALAMPFTALDGIGLGCRVELATGRPVIYPDESWLGRVINAMGEPIDGKGPLSRGRVAYALRAPPPPAHARQRVQGKVDLGVRAINTFLTRSEEHTS